MTFTNPVIDTSYGVNDGRLMSSVQSSNFSTTLGCFDLKLVASETMGMVSWPKPVKPSRTDNLVEENIYVKFIGSENSTRPCIFGDPKFEPDLFKFFVVEISGNLNPERTRKFPWAPLYPGF